MIFENNPCDSTVPEESFAYMLQESARKNGIPLSGTFELTPRCNFNCKMCYVHLKENEICKFGAELPVEEWIRLAEEARNAGMLHLCITGGEPLLYRDFEKFYRAVSQMGFEITLQTNAAMITEKTADLFNKLPPNLVKISVYGSDNSIYRDVCGAENGFSSVDAGIRKLKELKIPVILITTVIRQNKNDIVNIAKYANSLNLPWTYTATVQPSVRGAVQDKNAFLKESDYTDFDSDVRQMLAKPFRNPDDRPCEYCKGYRMSFWISWNGKMRFCSYMNEPDINVCGNSFFESWMRLLDYEKNLRWPDECYTCEIREYCHLCAGALAANSGSIKKVDKNFCDDLKRYINKFKAL